MEKADEVEFEGISGQFASSWQRRVNAFRYRAGGESKMASLTNNIVVRLLTTTINLSEPLGTSRNLSEPLRTSRNRSEPTNATIIPFIRQFSLYFSNFSCDFMGITFTSNSIATGWSTSCYPNSSITMTNDQPPLAAFRLFPITGFFNYRGRHPWRPLGATNMVTLAAVPPIPEIRSDLIIETIKPVGN